MATSYCRRSMCGNFGSRAFFSKLSPLTIFPEELHELRSSVRQFARKEILPIVSEMDKNSKMCPDLVKSVFDQGYMSIEIPEAYGGCGLKFMDSIIIIEEISRVDPSVGILVDIHNTLVNRAIIDHGTEEQHNSYLPRLAQDTIGAFALSETGAGSDAFSIKTRARKLANGDFTISGEKSWISNSREAGLFLLFVSTNPELGSRGITAFLVDPLKHAGIDVGKAENKLGIKASSTCPVWFNDVQVSKSSILGKEGDGGSIAISLLNEGRVGIAAQMLGIAKSALKSAIIYTKERQQFGQKICEFQAVKHQLAELATEIHAAELLVYNTASMKDVSDPRSFIKNCSMAKLFVSRIAEKAASQAIELMGGNGFTTDYPVEKLFRDSKIGAIYEGTSNIQLNTISKCILREEYDD